MSSSTFPSDPNDPENSYNSSDLLNHHTDEDFQLIKQSLEGNCDSYKELFMKYVNRIHSLCLRISADIHLAEDLTQEVFIKAWEKLDKFNYESKFSTWLHSIAVNQFLMHLRSEKRETDKTEEFGKENDTGLSKALQLQNDQRIDLENAIEKLPEQARTVLVLHDIEGYKHIEISKMMNIQSGTSKAHLHRARKILRKELSQ
ncbi:MAG TPA: RNA polymerase sigma factor [Ignavibacteria bacterium]|nr:RNA polymerase sigma factor [Ignavibacteria bacterium]